MVDETNRSHSTHWPSDSAGRITSATSLGAAGHVEHQLAADGHLRVRAVQQHGANPVPDGRAAGVARLYHRHATVAQKIGQNGDLCALARPVGAVNHDKLARQIVPRCAAHGFTGESIGETLQDYNRARCVVSGSPVRRFALQTNRLFVKIPLSLLNQGDKRGH